MAGKKKSRKAGSAEKGYTYDLDVTKRLDALREEKQCLENELKHTEMKLRKEKASRHTEMYLQITSKLREEIDGIDKRIALLTSQETILECDDKPIRIQTFAKVTMEDKLVNAYCAKCASPDLKITKIIQVECRKCGRKRLITARLDESKR